MTKLSKNITQKILFFNLKALEQSAQGNSSKLVNNLKDFYLYKENKLKKYYLPKVALSGGSSYLLNAYQLFLDNSLDAFKAQYIILAGRRDLNLYLEYGYKLLDLSLYPDLQLEKIKHNPLLTITSKHIQFKYE